MFGTDTCCEMYLPPFERDRNSFRHVEIHREMRLGTGGGAPSPTQPSVSFPTIPAG